MRKSFIVAYDIACPKRLSRMARICSDFGNRLQKSVFLCAMNDAENEMLVARVKKCIEKEEDQVMIFQLPPLREEAISIQTFGKPYLPEERSAFII